MEMLIIAIAALGSLIILIWNRRRIFHKILAPMRSKGRETAQDNGQFEASQLIQSARAHLARIETLLSDLGDNEAKLRAGRLHQTATLMIEALENEPNRHNQLQRHLGHYLTEAETVTNRFALHYRATRDQGSRTDYLSFMRELELQFEYEVRCFVTSGRDSLDRQYGTMGKKLRASSG